MKLFTSKSRKNGSIISEIPMNKQMRLRQRKLSSLILDIHSVTSLWFLIVMIFVIIFRVSYTKHCHYVRWYKTQYNRLISPLSILLSIVLLDIVSIFHYTVTQIIFLRIFLFHEFCL